MPGSAERGEDRPAETIATPSLDPSDLLDTNRRAIHAALDAQGEGLRHMARIGTSVLEFMQRRLRHDAEFAQQLGKLKAPEDAYTAYHDFFDAAVREYSDEFSALATLYVDQTRETMHEVERQVGEFARPVVAAE